jgi:hypothetical protein
MSRLSRMSELSSRVVVGAGVVVVVVVAGEAAAWAGTITDLTTGLTQRSGKPAGSMSHPPTQSAKCGDDRRTWFEDPPLGAFDAPTPEHSQNIRWRGSTQAMVFRPDPRYPAPCVATKKAPRPGAGP